MWAAFLAEFVISLVLMFKLYRVFCRNHGGVLHHCGSAAGD